MTLDTWFRFLKSPLKHVKSLTRSNAYLSGYASVPFARRSKATRLKIEQLEARNLLASWVVGFGGLGSELPGVLQTMDPSGNMFISGQYSSQSADFDPGPGTTNFSSAGYDAFVAKYATDGSMIWARSFGGTQSLATLEEI